MDGKTYFDPDPPTWHMLNLPPSPVSGRMFHWHDEPVPGPDDPPIYDGEYAVTGPRDDWFDDDAWLRAGWAGAWGSVSPAQPPPPLPPEDRPPLRVEGGFYFGITVGLCAALVFWAAVGWAIWH